MNDSGIVSFKVYLNQPNSDEPEIRRFGLQAPVVTCFNLFASKLTEVFPSLSDKIFRIYWKDEDDDKVAVSSDKELIMAITSMKENVKKFYIKVESVPNSRRNDKNRIVHENVFCDGCESNVVGFRYKCVVCNDYDLCEACDRAGVHTEHPMLRISDPLKFKIPHFMELFVSKDRHRSRKHCHDGCKDDGYPEGHKKHKKGDRRESETGDESEEGCQRKHPHHFHSSHKKMKKGKCPYNRVMKDVFTYLSPKNFDFQGAGEEPKEGTSEEYAHTKYLKTLGITLQKFLDPLGVEVDFEVRRNGEKEEEKKKAEPAKETPPPSPSAPPQKEVRFANTDEVTKQEVDEIAKLLAKQTMGGNSAGSSGGNSGNNNAGNSGSSSSSNSVIGKGSDNDGWVELEELEKDCEDSRPSASTGAIPKAPQRQEKVPAEGSKQPETPKAPKGQNLYPNLGSEETSTNPLVRKALEQMLSMGFTNENNCLSVLLKANGGNISQVLEMLDQMKKM